jgi:CubicO group peptidase (beta-lactamase class C family)
MHLLPFLALAVLALPGTPRCEFDARAQEPPKPDKPIQDKPKPPDVPATDKEKLLAHVDELARRAVEEEGVPGLSIAVARDGEMLVAKGFGYADAARAQPARADTRYAIGSLTRQFTAVAILQLVDDEKLALEDEIGKHLPGFPAGKRKITLQHLLANTSGIPGLKKIVARHPEVLLKRMDEAAFFKVFADVPFDFEPGEDFSLDSANYVLLSMILSKKAGTSHADFVMKNVVQAAGLEQTVFCPLKEKPVGFAADCEVLAEEPELEIPLAAAPEYSTQSLCSTVTDLVKWQQALVERTVFSERASRLIMTPAELPDGNSTNYGYAVRMSKLGDFKSYSHSGGVGGFRVTLVYYSLPKVTIAILANCATAPVDRIEREIAGFVLGLPPEPSTDLALPPEEAARCAGLYQIATTQVRIELRDGKLYYSTANGPTVRLLYQGRLSFAFETEPETKLTFTVKDEKCDGFTLLRGGFQTTGKRME